VTMTLNLQIKAIDLLKHVLKVFTSIYKYHQVYSKLNYF